MPEGIECSILVNVLLSEIDASIHKASETAATGLVEGQNTWEERVIHSGSVASAEVLLKHCDRHAEVAVDQNKEEEAVVEIAPIFTRQIIDKRPESCDFVIRCGQIVDKSPEIL